MSLPSQDQTLTPKNFKKEKEQNQVEEEEEQGGGQGEEQEQGNNTYPYKNQNNFQIAPNQGVNLKFQPRTNKKNHNQKLTSTIEDNRCQVCKVSECHFYSRSENLKLCYNCLIKTHPSESSYLKHRVCVWGYHMEPKQNERKRKNPISTTTQNTVQKKFLLKIGNTNLNNQKSISLITHKKKKIKKKKNNSNLTIKCPIKNPQDSNIKYKIISKKSIKNLRNSKLNKKNIDKTYRFPSSSNTNKPLIPRFSIRTRNMKKKTTSINTLDNNIINNLNFNEKYLIRSNNVNTVIKNDNNNDNTNNDIVSGEGNNNNNNNGNNNQEKINTRDDDNNSNITQNIKSNRYKKNSSEMIYKESSKTFNKKIKEIQQLDNISNTYTVPNKQMGIKKEMIYSLPTDNDLQKKKTKRKIYKT
ncbi:hypothetical protein M0812_03192 [Anaeramoeba flamelloides]|uniref:Uncharacterized protein n=1 Tax=Anaeramoeba flamelloides TaxID=1746091 RepID=A0AAV8AGV7_9EUKA|nr:hypothetical protein M0812_03192 [Anaeramoeba flamelloides]